MREPTIARNYAQALFEAGERLGETQRIADLADALAGAIAEEHTVRVVLESPRVRKATKQKILRRAFEGHAPEQFIRFLEAVIKRGRQGIIPAITEAYLALVDEKFNRVHAGITMAREPNKPLQKAVRTKLSEVFGKEVIPHFRTDASILGGLIVRIGDRIMDGSLRRQMVTLRRSMLGI